ncbi:fasciclin domain-containing protein [Polaromonas sp. CG_9.11]|uniref:fasciclin domain-containing protein n=1 Tax=Polaromonas sp. CG_9.11 TaxID=2787730 RepID=UPI0018CBA79A|nr:fasciclin domain-containing protein [Polaromonas sp. CG_9.11]MBG6076262.1 putative surface protein with fasciclin (FAS1) repeats [Polaromonas sp. CG_9.11]
MLKRYFVIALATSATAAMVAGCATGPRPVAVPDTLAAQSRLSTLNSLVAKAGLTDTLKTSGPFTMFAPTNEAFAKVPAKTMEALASDPVQLKAVLGYHILPVKLMAADVKNGSSKTLNGASLALSKAGNFVTAEEALVLTPDILATNGVVHVVDSVLLPPASR